jgi:hypothetical protein
MLIHGKPVDLNLPATLYEDRFNHGTFFPHLAQAIRHAAANRKLQSASIVTQSGEQFGWAEISVLHDHLRTNPTSDGDDNGN